MQAVQKTTQKKKLRLIDQRLCRAHDALVVSDDEPYDNEYNQKVPSIGSPFISSNNDFMNMSKSDRDGETDDSDLDFDIDALDVPSMPTK